MLIVVKGTAMSINKKKIRGHHPKGLELLYEDDEIIVVDKPCGLLTMGTERDKSRTAHSALNEYVRKGNARSRNRVYIVHRLDRDTSGILLFAKSEPAKMFLQEHWADTEKRYLTVVHGRIVQKTGTISSYLTENSAFRVYSIADPVKGKLSLTVYKVLKETNDFSLLEINLLTGRKHQIRVHLSDKGHPVVGDDKYGKGNDLANNLALHSTSISFQHPVSGMRLTFETKMPDRFTRLVGTLAGQPH